MDEDVSALGNGNVLNPIAFGAIADGRTRSTTALQSAIDVCHDHGGGTVWLSSGVFVTGTLVLKSNVRLHLEAGAVLRACDDLDAFPSVPSLHPAYTGEYVTHKALIRAEDAANIAITGQGTLDGNGEAWANGPYGSPSFSLRPRILYFRACTRVRVSDVTLCNSASWVQTYQSCRDVRIHGITVDSRENPNIELERYARVRGRNTDGLDLVDCQGVRVSDCHITSGDDGICLKSLSPDEACRDIVITNCVVSSNASGIKIGTESSGAFSDIAVSNCVVYDTRCDGIALMTVDGARLERVSISNVRLRNIKQAGIFIRLGARGRSYRRNAEVRKGALRDVLIQNVQGAGLSGAYACSITGLVGQPVEHIHLDHINLESEGGITDVPREPVPEKETTYPSGRMFGPLPAYGFYVRHARNISLRRVQMRTLRPDARPPCVMDDVEGLELDDATLKE